MATLPKLTTDKDPKLSYRTQREFEMRETSFPADVDEKISGWLYEQIRTRRRQLEKRHKVYVPEWRRIAEGKPKEEKKSWPFENCANLVHQIVGEGCDDLAARVMQIVWATAPIVLYRYFTQTKSDDEAAHNTKKARLLEQFMDYVAYEPNELNLWDKENIWFSDSAKLGTAWLCIVPEKRVEAVYIGYESKRTKFEEATLYEGPLVLNLRDEEVLYDPDADCPEDSDFLSRRITLSRRQLQEREFRGLYKKGSVTKILGKPDRYGPDETQKKAEKSKGVTAVEDHVLAEWDVEECYFYWYHNQKKYRLIAWFHYETETVMNQVFNFIPENQIPIVRTRLSSGEKGMNGQGLADMGKYAQEEISTTKNQRIDATTWMMLGINRVSTMNKNIDRNFKLFPGAMAPFGKDEFEHFDVGNPAILSASQANEQMMIQQARERFGVGPAVAGTGAGGAIDKKGRYGANATFMILSEGNTRVNHRTSDFRHAHAKACGLLTDMYGAMGLGRKGSLFGLDDKMLEEALSDFLERRVRIPIRAATASANKEVTKQNEMMLNQAIGMFVKEATTMLQAVVNSGVPPFVQKWLKSVVKARVRLMQQTVRDFQLSDQPEEYVPTIEFEDEKESVPNAPQKEGLDPRVIQMADSLRKGGGVAVAGQPSGMDERGGGPPGALPGAAS